MQKIQYKGGLSTENSSAYPSKEIWGDCPVGDILLDPTVGYHFYDDFLSFPTITTPTITTQAAWANGYKAFGSSGGTITMPTAASLVGGVVLTETDDNEGVGLATIQLPYKIIQGGGKLWFEARFKTNVIDNTKHGLVCGLWGSQTLSATVPIAADGTLADLNFVGFHRLEGDGDMLDTVYKADGVTQVTVQADAITLVADTFVKVGMVFDPTTGVLTFYKNGVALSTTKSIPTAAGTDFPNDVQLGLCFAQLCASSDDAISTLSWWRCAQLK